MSKGHKQLRRKLINFVLQRLCQVINRVDSIFGNARPRAPHKNHTYLRESVLDHEEASARRGAGHSRERRLLTHSAQNLEQISDAID
eukprot:scaffold1897_cov236-Chaetoceros_neogracile.AAC.13